MHTVSSLNFLHTSNNHSNNGNNRNIPCQAEAASTERALRMLDAPLQARMLLTAGEFFAGF